MPELPAAASSNRETAEDLADSIKGIQELTSLGVRFGSEVLIELIELA